MTDKNKDVIIHNCQRAGQENDGIVCLMIEVRALHGVTFFLKFIYSEKATKFCEISTILLTGTT